MDARASDAAADAVGKATSAGSGFKNNLPLILMGGGVIICGAAAALAVYISLDNKKQLESVKQHLTETTELLLTVTDAPATVPTKAVRAPESNKPREQDQRQRAPAPKQKPEARSAPAPEESESSGSDESEEESELDEEAAVAPLMNAHQQKPAVTQPQRNQRPTTAATPGSKKASGDDNRHVTFGDPDVI
jgi:type IV secretory pathway VirB10-like protein